MKKSIIFTLALLCAFLLSACGANPAGEQTTAAVPTLETSAGDGSVTDPAILTEPGPDGICAGNIRIALMLLSASCRVLTIWMKVSFHTGHGFYGGKRLSRWRFLRRRSMIRL